MAWRDAVRSWLVVDDNRDLLGRLLREVAAPTGGSRSVKLSFVKNREWIAKVQGRIDVAAWLAPRRAEIDVEGTRYDVALEERSARGPAHGDPVRDVPRARQRLECGVDGAERRRREQARALRPQP